MYDRYKSICIWRNFNCIFDIIVLLYFDLFSEKVSFKFFLLGLSDEIYVGLFVYLMNFCVLFFKKLFNVDKCIFIGYIENLLNF